VEVYVDISLSRSLVRVSCRVVSRRLITVVGLCECELVVYTVHVLRVDNVSDCSVCLSCDTDRPYCINMSLTICFACWFVSHWVSSACYNATCIRTRHSTDIDATSECSITAWWNMMWVFGAGFN